MMRINGIILCEGETDILNSLADNDIEKNKVIKQVKDFVSNLDSDVYLQKRRERVKAELGVSVAVFSPDKVFTEMSELISSVRWENLDYIHSQFALLREI